MYSQEVFFIQTQYLIPPEVQQVPPYEAQQMAQGLAGDLALFLFPLLVTLDRLLDKRLVLTFLQTIQVILAYRDRVGGLLLSELGGCASGMAVNGRHRKARLRRTYVPCVRAKPNA